MSDEETVIFERGDVVYGADPFNGEKAARPWLILSNHDDRPFHGEQYIALTLTTKSWMDGLIEIPEESWRRGGTPEESRIVPWTYSRLPTRILTSGRVVLTGMLSTRLWLPSSKNCDSGTLEPIR